MTELTIRTAIVKALKERGVYVLVTTGVGMAGTPDIIACVDGRFVAFEVKDAHGRLTHLQLHRLEQIKLAGGHARLVRSVGAALEVIDD